MPKLGQALGAATKAKLERLHRGAPGRVLDLFSGAGGISLGFKRAGFDIIGAVEIDKQAALTHARNFHGSDNYRLALHGKSRDITVIEPKNLVRELGLGPLNTAVDVLVGGPPCQAYARVGRAKLREVAQHPEAYKIDPRGDLFLRYLAYVKALQPLALLIENVPDILHYGRHNVIEEIIDALADLGYLGRYTLINSAFHGCPQMRDRVYLLAYRAELEIDVRFPKATHFVDLPKGYAHTRAVALKYVDLVDGKGYAHTKLGQPGLPLAVSAEEAIGDLPPILGSSVGPGKREFKTLAEYSLNENLSDFALEMRNWPGFRGTMGVLDHVIRYLPRDHRVFAAMRQGAEYPEAHAAAVKIAERAAARLELRQGTRKYKEVFDSIVPPYDVSKFPNRWWKLRRDFPVRTIMAHIGKDTYSHIHYDSAQARTISVREAARLQTFPDGFIFSGAMNSAFKQIGNAVPPLMAFEMAKIVKKALSTVVRQKS